MEGNEIVKALRVCATTKPCSECPYEVDEGKCWTKDFAAADLIEKQERQIQTLKRERDVAVEQAAGDKLRWIPVTDRLPEIGVRVLTLDKRGHIRDRILRSYTNGEPYFYPGGLKNEEYARICGAMMSVADCVGFLPDWQDSPGAQVEYAWCKYVGKPMMGLRGEDEA